MTDRGVPEITRARGFRLYTARGTRLVDLWQYGGRAILGHNPPGLLRTIKNGAERGLFAPLPNAASGRLFRALAVLFPGCSFGVYRDGTGLYRAPETAGFRPLPLWRPFRNEAVPDSLFVPVLPFPFPGAPEVLARKAERAGALPSDTVSPVALAAAARCAWDLAAALASGVRAVSFPAVERALKDNPRWKRRGIYLSRAGVEDYADLFRRFLEGGFLLPPSPEEEAILPGELSPGEEKKLAGLLR